MVGFYLRGTTATAQCFANYGLVKIRVPNSCGVMVQGGGTEWEVNLGKARKVVGVVEMEVGWEDGVPRMRGCEGALGGGNGGLENWNKCSPTPWTPEASGIEAGAQRAPSTELLLSACQEGLSINGAFPPNKFGLKYR